MLFFWLGCSPEGPPLFFVGSVVCGNLHLSHLLFVLQRTGLSSLSCCSTVQPFDFQVLVPFDPMALLPDHHLLLAFLSLPWRNHIPLISFLGLLKQNITTAWLKVVGDHFLIVLEAQSLGSRCQQVLAPSGGHFCPHPSSSSWRLLPLFTWV